MADRIFVRDLRRAVEMLLDAVEAADGDDIDLTADYYWRVSPSVAYDPHARPGDAIEAGQLSDDANELRQLLLRDPSEVVLWHDLDHVASLLAWVAARHLPQA